MKKAAAEDTVNARDGPVSTLYTSLKSLPVRPIAKSSNYVKAGSKPLYIEKSHQNNMRRLRELNAMSKQPIPSETRRHSDRVAGHRNSSQHLVSFTEREKSLLPPCNDQEWSRERRLSRTTHILADDHTGTERKILDTSTDDVEQADNRHLRQKLETQSKTRRLGKTCPVDTDKALDKDTVHSLQDILRDGQLHSERRSSKDLSVDAQYNRAQMKRLQHLEEFLKNLESVKREYEFDPMKILECRYLRLSPYNVEQLERMVRESGRDPGIHCHSDLREVNIFEKPKSSEIM